MLATVQVGENSIDLQQVMGPDTRHHSLYYVFTVGLGHDFREPERGSFYEYLIFFDDSFCDHHHITCTLPE